MEPYWDQNGHAPHPIKYESEAAVSGFPYCTESSLNFSTSGTPYSEDDTEYAPGRRNKTSRQDPLSHRIIEKRRRDRMNSCLADLSRLIPPQYQRKGRGRIEKTEIIEMAIRHLKHLQNECVHKDIEYKLGYSDCMKEAAKFLYESHMQDCCYRLIAHLQEHCDEVLKGECFKNRCNVETISASSGSPAQNTNYHNASSVPLSQLRDMLTSDVEHSNDNNDIKDLSFRNHHHHQSHQAPVITSTAPSSICHDSSNHDFDSSRDISHHENELSSPPPLHHHLHHIHSLVNQQQQHNSGTTSSVSVTPHHHLMENGTKVNGGGSNNNGSIISSGGAGGGGITLKTIRMRNFSESSHDIENNNNNYKYKNHIKERFNHDAHLNDESTSEDHSIPPTINITERTSPIIITEKPLSNKLLESSNNETTLKKRKLDSNKEDNNVNNTNTITNNNNINNSKNNNNNSNNNKNINNTAINDIKIEPSSPQINSNSIKNPNNINNGVGGRHFPVPIFALHGQGTYYVPLNIDYDSLLPYLNGIDLLDKNFCPIQMLHPVNINVNFTIPTTSSQTFSGITRPVGLPTAAILPRSKIEKLSNGW